MVPLRLARPAFRPPQAIQAMTDELADRHAKGYAGYD